MTQRAHDDYVLSVKRRKVKDRSAQALARKRWDAVGKSERRRIAMCMVAARKRSTRGEFAGYRKDEAKWRETHARELEPYAGEWVVLECQSVVAHGLDPASLVRQARERGIQIPYIFFVEPKKPEVVRLGI